MVVLIISIILVLLFIKPIYHGISDGITGKTQYRHIYDSDYIMQLELIEQRKHELVELITNIEILIDRDYEIGKLLDIELKKATGKQRITILNKITTLDNRTYRNTQKLNKLKQELEELE